MPVSTDSQPVRVRRQVLPDGEGGGREQRGALGIALLGALGVSVYRNALPAAGAERSLGDAVVITGQRAAELLEQARSAFEQAFVTMTGTASLAVLAALAILALISRRAWNDGGNDQELELRSRRTDLSGR